MVSQLRTTIANLRLSLAEIEKTAIEELQALELVGKVDEARRSLQDLKQKLLVSGEYPAAPGGIQREEIRRLEQYIAEHSKLAEWAITSSYQEQEGR